MTKSELKEHVRKENINWDIRHSFDKVFFHSKTKHKILFNKIKGLSIENFGGTINLECSCGKCGIKIKGQAKNKKKMENTENNEPEIIERDEKNHPLDCPPEKDCGMNDESCVNCSIRLEAIKIKED